jgi:hypothetical protein
MIEWVCSKLPYNIYSVNGQIKAVNRHCSVSTMTIMIEGPEFDSPQNQATVIAMNESLNYSLRFFYLFFLFIFRICTLVTTVGNISAEIQLYLEFNLR